MAVVLARVDSQRNMARFYEIQIQPTLFGEFAVWRHWGRIGTSGQSKSFWFTTEEIAEIHAQKIEHTKRRRGYDAPPLQAPLNR